MTLTRRCGKRATNSLQDRKLCQKTGFVSAVFKFCSSFEKFATTQTADVIFSDTVNFQHIVPCFQSAFNFLLKRFNFENSMNMAAVNRRGTLLKVVL